MLCKSDVVIHGFLGAENQRETCVMLIHCKYAVLILLLNCWNAMTGSLAERIHFQSVSAICLMNLEVLKWVFLVFLCVRLLVEFNNANTG